MSSWVHDWERALIPKVNGVKAKARTQCKLGRHLILDGVAAVWLRSPMGLSCLPCAEEVAPELVAQERARLAGPVKLPPARKRRERVHGKPGTYSAGCRCEECKAASSAAQAIYRQRRRERLGRDRVAKVATA